MKAISLWQPWASAIASGSKRIETRSWATNYRGPLLIHAARRCVKEELVAMSANWMWRAALALTRKHMSDNRQLWDVLPFGAIVARCNLVECVRTGSLSGDILDYVRT